MTTQQIFLYPADILYHFLLSLTGFSSASYGLDILLTALLAIVLWVKTFKALFAVIKRFFGFYEGAE